MIRRKGAAVTMEEIVQGNPRIVKSARGDLRATHIADRKGRNVAVAIDPHGKLHYGQANAGGDHIIAVLSEEVSDNYLVELREDGVSYLFAGPNGSDLRGALETLGKTFGLRTLLLEDLASDEWCSMILFGLYSGQRLGDCHLKWNKIDSVNGGTAFFNPEDGKDGDPIHVPDRLV
jgi:hypothetical protein